MWAAGLIAFSPAGLSRLSFAFLAAVFAHFLDTLVLASLFPRGNADRPNYWITACLLLLALAAYPGSLINFGIFFPILGVLLLIGVTPELRRVGLTLLAGSAGVAVLVLSIVYREFVGVFVTELLPSFLAGGSRGGSLSPVDAIATLGARYWIFYGGVYLPLLVGGVGVWLWRKTESLCLPPSPSLGRDIHRPHLPANGCSRSLQQGQRNPLDRSSDLTGGGTGTRLGAKLSSCWEMDGPRLLFGGGLLRRRLLHRRHRREVRARPLMGGVRGVDFTSREKAS